MSAESDTRWNRPRGMSQASVGLDSEDVVSDVASKRLGRDAERWGLEIMLDTLAMAHRQS